LKQHERQLHLSIRDNGVGFDPTALKPGRHGLQNLHERAKVVGAGIEVASEKEKGTEVRIRVAG
jgi:signal transduction histidine kinase